MFLDLHFLTHPYKNYPLLKTSHQHQTLYYPPQSSTQARKHHNQQQKDHYKMLSPFICGSGNFHEEEDEEPCTTPKRSSRRNSFCRRQNKENKNPYSTRGLDKFSALLADLEEKRQRIYSQLDSQETSLVRFVFKDSDDCVPIVVRLKDKKGQDKIKNGHGVKERSDKPQTESSAASVQEIKKESEQGHKRVNKRGFSWRAELWRPAFYLPAALILILVFLAVFGRSAAVLCTSVGWYLLPTLQGEKSNVKNRSMKKREYRTRLSEKKMVVKSADSSPPAGAAVQGRHGHRKSF